MNYVRSAAISSFHFSDSWLLDERAAWMSNVTSSYRRGLGVGLRNNKNRSAHRAVFSAAVEAFLPGLLKCCPLGGDGG